MDLMINGCANAQIVAHFLSQVLSTVLYIDLFLVSRFIFFCIHFVAIMEYILHSRLHGSFFGL